METSYAPHSNAGVMVMLLKYNRAGPNSQRFYNYMDHIQFKVLGLGEQVSDRLDWVTSPVS